MNVPRTTILKGGRIRPILVCNTFGIALLTAPRAKALLWQTDNRAASVHSETACSCWNVKLTRPSKRVSPNHNGQAPAGQVAWKREFRQELLEDDTDACSTT